MQLRVQRHHAHRFAAPAEVGATGAGRRLVRRSRSRSTSAPTARRLLPARLPFARELPGKGAPHARPTAWAEPSLGRAVAAVISDDDRAIVAWTVRHDGQTSVYVSQLPARRSLHAAAAARSISRPSRPARLRRLAPPRAPLLGERDARVDGRGRRALGDPRRGDRPCAACSRRARSRPPAGTRCSPASRRAPNDEALALWSEPQPTAAGLDLGEQAIFAARGFDGYPEHAEFARPRTARPAGTEQRSDRRLRPR